jgi:uncharacterized membrane protein
MQKWWQRFIAGIVLLFVGILVAAAGQEELSISALSWMLVASGVILVGIGLRSAMKGG